VIMYATFSPSVRSSPHEENVLKKEYFEATNEKCYKEQNLISFVTRRESSATLC
jgi:hypothetical protein